MAPTDVVKDTLALKFVFLEISLVPHTSVFVETNPVAAEFVMLELPRVKLFPSFIEVSANP